MTLPFEPQITSLEKRHDRGAFTCGKVQLDTYLQQHASQDLRKKVAATKVLQAKGQDTIIGFYTLAAAQVEVGQLPEDIIKHLPKKRPIPCTLLAQLGIATEWQGKGVASWLLGHVLTEVWLHSQAIGSFVLLVDAVDEGAANYWQHQGFIPFPATSVRLFLPMATIGKLFT